MSKQGELELDKPIEIDIETPDEALEKTAEVELETRRQTRVLEELAEKTEKFLAKNSLKKARL